MFLAGGGTVGLDYLNVQRRAAELATSVIYDRAGTGWSERVDLPRRSAEVIDELRALLTVADVPAPYLLVGHSLGGLYARHYAQRYPGEVSGLVLLDPAHEDYNAYMPKDLVDQWTAWDADEVLPDELPEELIQFYLTLFEQEMADWPEEIRRILIERHVSVALVADWSPGSEERRPALRRDPPRRTDARYTADHPYLHGYRLVQGSGVPGISDSLLREEIEGKVRLYTTWADSFGMARTGSSKTSGT